MRTPVPRTIITCTVTGTLATKKRMPFLPVTPAQIADASWEAASVGASVVHLQLRDPSTGEPCTNLGLYHEVVERIRRDSPDLIINLTVEPAVRFVTQQHHKKVVVPAARLGFHELQIEDIAGIRPDICTVGFSTRGAAGDVAVNAPANARRMARVVREAGVKPEIEIFDAGDIALLHELLADGTLAGPVVCLVVMGMKRGFQSSPETIIHARNLLPSDSHFTAIGMGRSSFESVALSYLSGGHARVGIDDAIHLRPRVPAASSGLLVQKARRIVEDLGGEIASPEEARAILGLCPLRDARVSTRLLRSPPGTEPQ